MLYHVACTELACAYTRQMSAPLMILIPAIIAIASVTIVTVTTVRASVTSFGFRSIEQCRPTKSRSQNGRGQPTKLAAAA